jgi:hypothetical protein
VRLSFANPAVVTLYICIHFVMRCYAVVHAHSQLVKALVDLYEKYRGQYGWHDRELVVT